jgi:DNA-binding beta-propeller fold protein YncE
MKYSVQTMDWQMGLSNVGGVAVDAEDNVYVAVRAPMTPIVVFDREGNFIRDIGTGMGVQNAHGIHVDREQNVYLVDGNRHVVHKFAQDGRLLLTLGNLDKPSLDSGAINGDYKTIKQAGSPFYSPAKVSTNKEGDIYVSDGYGNCCIHRFSPEGELILSWGAPGDEPGAFRIPHGIGVDWETGDVYVADRENLRMQVFDGEGHLKAIWEQMHRPTDVFIRDGLVYVSELGELLFTDNVCYDLHAHRQFSQVRVFDKNGRELTQIGTANGGAAGSFLGAHGICADSRGDVYVCEVNNWDIYSAFAAWPGGEGMPVGRHPALQKFKYEDE